MSGVIMVGVLADHRGDINFRLLFMLQKKRNYQLNSPQAARAWQAAISARRSSMAHK